jgi:hypothetical protein
LLPNPYPSCKSKYYDNIPAAALLVMFGIEKTCFDVLFSGHSVVIMLYTCFFFRYTENIYLKCAIFPITLMASVFIVATHFHYAIDVLYGELVAVFVFITYHYLYDEIHERLKENYVKGQEKRTNIFDVGVFNDSIFAKRLLVAFVVWLESLDYLIPKHNPNDSIKKKEPFEKENENYQLKENDPRELDLEFGQGITLGFPKFPSLSNTLSKPQIEELKESDPILGK